MSSSQIDEIKNSISRYLSIREHSRSELFDKLFQKKFESDDIETCLDSFAELGLQSDERFVETYVQSKYHNQKGPNLIRSELIKKKINIKIINKYLTLYDDNEWLESAIKALDKKSYPNTLTDDKIIEKQKFFLSNRGFIKKTIDDAINKFWKL
tara:strand:- start:629 stop:1090 length:462 start_codon:yes stop_codon:yes gene_type:complete